MNCARSNSLGLMLRVCVLMCCVVSQGWSRSDEPPMGVTFDGRATQFRVWAPYASSVAVIGDFNGWRPRASDRLELDRRTGIWSGSIAGSRLRGGYQFLINDSLRRRDPYARAVTDDGRSSLFYDPAAYRWRDITPPRYELDELIIYEMHIGTFFDPRPDNGQPATFSDAIRRLDHLVELGVNTICLLPVHEFNGNHSWGYNPSDLFAVEQAYGGPDEFKRFIEACHVRGLAVHLDIVHNHYGPENLDLLQFDGTGNPDNGGIYFYEGPGIGMTPWGPRVRFEQPMVQRFIRDNALMWMNEYRVDGFRWDSTVNIRAYNQGADPIPEGAEMLESINRLIRADYPGRWSIAEDSLDIGHFHGSWDYDFHHLVMPSLAAPADINRNMRQVATALSRVPRRMWRVVYVDNHDEAGLLNNETRIASDIDPANPGSDYARRLSGLGAVLTFTAPGIPLLFMGNEFQEEGTWHDDRPLDWTKARRNQGMVALHRDLIGLRRNLEGHSLGLRGLRIELPVIDEENKQLVYWRAHGDQPLDQVVVAINFSSVEQDLVLPFPSRGPWLMRLNTDWTEYGGETRRPPIEPFTLAQGALAQTVMTPYSARIFTLAERPTKSSVPSPVQPTADVPYEPPKDDAPFSIWQTIQLTGTFNDWDPAAWPFTLAEDYLWEGFFYFDGTEAPRFKITANDRDTIYWGRPAGRVEEGETMSIVARRLGPEFTMRQKWQGLYLFRFNENTRQLDIMRIGDDPLPDPDPEPEHVGEPHRVWTSVRGATVTARLLQASFDSPVATMETQQGDAIEIPIRSLSPEDRAYIRDWILQQND